MLPNYVLCFLLPALSVAVLCVPFLVCCMPHTEAANASCDTHLCRLATPVLQNEFNLLLLRKMHFMQYLWFYT